MGLWYIQASYGCIGRLKTCDLISYSLKWEKIRMLKKNKNRVSVIKSDEGVILKISRVSRLEYLLDFKFLIPIIYITIHCFVLAFFMLFLGTDPVLKLNIIKWVWKGTFFDYLISPLPWSLIIGTILFLLNYAAKEQSLHLLIYGDRKFRVWRNKESQLIFDGKIDTELVIAYSPEDSDKEDKIAGVHYVSIAVADFKRGKMQSDGYCRAATSYDFYYSILFTLYDEDIKKVVNFRKQHQIRKKEK